MGKVIQLPQTQFSAKPPRKLKNADVRPRTYLTKGEVEKMISAARKVGDFGHRDATLLMTMFRHGLRCGEASDLQWAAIDFEGANMHVRRLKRGQPSTHPIQGDELRALRRLRRSNPNARFVFMSKRRTPLSTRAIRSIVQRAGELAEIGFPVNAHALRHSTGFHLANKGVDTRTIQAFLGHTSIVSTQIYTQIAPGRFEGLWED